MRHAAILVAVIATSSAFGADEPRPLFVLPVATIRNNLPDKGQDGVPITVLGEKENPNNWFEIAFGKRLKVRPADRKADKEKRLGVGFAAREGYIDILLGWRGRNNSTHWKEFDGTLTARLSLVLINGKWDAKVEYVKSHWDEALPILVW